MYLKILSVIVSVACLIACSTGPSVSNCYGTGQLGCEAYWKNGTPKSLVVEAKVDDEFARKYNIPDKQKYINRDETLSAKKWKKIGVSRLETQKAILECGGGVFWGNDAFELMKVLPLDEYNNGLVLVKKCMLNNSFIYSGSFDICVVGSPIPACQPNTSPPLRKISNRLDGKYCVAEPTIHECEPQSFERRINSAYCDKYPERGICQEHEQKLFCNQFPKADECQPYGNNFSPEIKKETSSLDGKDVSPFTESERTSASSNNRFLELLFPAFYHTSPIDPESQKYSTRELERQQLQRNTQNQSNKQMNENLKNSAPKTRR